jgi:hypothetical protein
MVVFRGMVIVLVLVVAGVGVYVLTNPFTDMASERHFVVLYLLALWGLVALLAILLGVQRSKARAKQ